MSEPLCKTLFYFPQNVDKPNSQSLASSIVKEMQDDGSIEYAGYLSDKDLEQDLAWQFQGVEKSDYKPLSNGEKKSITATINTTLEKCFAVLPHPDLPIYTFGFPWFPRHSERDNFGGVFAMAVHANVMHLFFAQGGYTDTSIAETIAHEYNHLIYYRYKSDNTYRLIDHLVMEGLAEVFREEVMEGEKSPWSVVFEKNEAFVEFKKLQDKLSSTNEDLHNAILFGGGEYSRWTGYSIGYWLIKDFRKKNSSVPWVEIMQKSAEFFVPEKSEGA